MTPFNVTAWARRADTATDSGRGRLRAFASTEELAEGLREEAALPPRPPGPDGKIDKSDGECFALGASLRGGSSDEECIEISGILLDADFVDGRSQEERFSSLEADLQSNGFRYTMQTRGGKAHVILPFEHPTKPTANGKAEREALIASIGSAVGMTFDLTPARRDLGLIYSYRNVGTGPIVTTWGEGRGLPFTPTAGPETTVRSPRVRPGDAPPDTMTPEETQRIIASKARANTRADRTPILDAFFLGEAWAPDGLRDQTAQKLASWFAWYTGGRGDIETIVTMAVASLDAIALANPSTHIDETCFADKVRRAMADAWAQLNPDAQALAGLRNAPAWKRLQTESVRTTTKTLFGK